MQEKNYLRKRKKIANSLYPLPVTLQPFFFPFFFSISSYRHTSKRIKGSEILFRIWEIRVGIKKAGKVVKPSPPFLKTISLTVKLFQSDNNGSHEVTLLPIFFGRLRVFVMAIGTAVRDRIIGGHANGRPAIFRYDHFFFSFC